MAPNPFAVIAGVGPGTGAALARRFALSYPVVLLARKEESFKSVVADIKANGGSAVGIETDVSIESSLRAAFEQVKTTFGSDSACAVSGDIALSPRYITSCTHFPTHRRPPYSMPVGRSSKNLS
jgi:NAD(P)-dependent dehydrogenase (short-subunit alcohol dehydrogenase family)